jgi:1A family penicillin-binding protein
MFGISTKKRRNRRFQLLNHIPILLGLGLFIFGLLLLWVSSFRIPDLDTFEDRVVRQSTKIYDRTGEILLFDVHENIQRTIISNDEISRNIKNATVAIEDAEFYEHKGVRPMATIRAVFLQPLKGKGVQGGSTITQQVIKNSLLTSEKKISRKIKEWVLAIKLEKILTKEEILAHYLNESPYGGNIYGIEEASQRFFGKSATEVTLAESAYLAALPQAPTYYSPYGNNREALNNRKNLVLVKMLENAFITNEEYEEAKKEIVTFIPRASVSLQSPHFVQFIREYLENNYGQKEIEERGFRVTTTLDYDLQKSAEEIVKKHALENAEKFNAENAGLVAVDPKTGEILAMVGSRDYFDTEIDGNFNITLAHRQPGSAFKPFVYATAFEKGYTPETVVFDLKTEFSTLCTPSGKPLVSGDSCYHPSNYDDIFRGPMSLRDALAQSVNIPAVKVLYLTGISDSVRTAKDLGVTLGDTSDLGLTLVLGGGEVTPLEMASSYGVFANDGIKNPPVGILKIEDSEGNIVEEYKSKNTRVLGENTSRLISDVLSDNVARTPAFGSQSYLHFPNTDVAVKTGTTNDYRDAWIVGYTRDISVAAWAGNNDNSPMEKKVAGFIIAPLWNEFMQTALPKFKNESFTPPESFDENINPVLRGFWKGGINYFIDTISGKLATEFTPEETKQEKVVTQIHSILHWVDKKDPTGESPKNPSEDFQYNSWEYAVQNWAALSGIQNETEDIIPKEKDTIHGPQFAPEISINNLQNTYSQTDKPSLFVSSSGIYELSQVEFYLNNSYIGKATKSPFSIGLDLENSAIKIGQNSLKIIAQDNVYNKSIKEFSFSVQ